MIWRAIDQSLAILSSLSSIETHVGEHFTVNSRRIVISNRRRKSQSCHQFKLSPTLVLDIGISCDFEGKGWGRLSWAFGAEISTLARTKCLELGLVDFSTFLTIKINLKDNLKSVA